MTVDRLEDDDGVVDEAPHRQRQPAEGKGVQRLPGGVQDQKRDGERQRDRDGDDQRSPHALEEDQDDDADEDEGRTISFLRP